MYLQEPVRQTVRFLNCGIRDILSIFRVDPCHLENNRPSFCHTSRRSNNVSNMLSSSKRSVPSPPNSSRRYQTAACSERRLGALRPRGLRFGVWGGAGGRERDRGRARHWRAQGRTFRLRPILTSRWRVGSPHLFPRLAFLVSSCSKLASGATWHTFVALFLPMLEREQCFRARESRRRSVFLEI